MNTTDKNQIQNSNWTQLLKLELLYIRYNNHYTPTEWMDDKYFQEAGQLLYAFSITIIYFYFKCT